MKLKPLKKINIKGTNWRIIREVEEGILGETVGEDKLIKIHHDLKGDRLQITFWHEFIHAVFSELYITAKLSDDLEEIIADNLATAITKVMKNELRKFTLEVKDE